MIARRGKARHSGPEASLSSFLLSSVNFQRRPNGQKSTFLGVFLQAQRARELRTFRGGLDAQVEITLSGNVELDFDRLVDFEHILF